MFEETVCVKTCPKTKAAGIACSPTYMAANPTYKTKCT